MTKPWAVAYTAAGQLQAQILSGLLQASGIPTQILQEGAGAQYALTVGALGEADLLVPADQLAEAQALLAAYEHGDLATDDENPAADPAPPPEP